MKKTDSQDTRNNAELVRGFGLENHQANMRHRIIIRKRPSVLLLAKYNDGDAKGRLMWLCSRNDATGNVAVMVAALAVWATMTKSPYFILAAIMAGLFLYSSLQILRQSLQEIRTGSSTT